MRSQSRRRLVRALSLSPLSMLGWRPSIAGSAPPRTVLLKLDDVQEQRRGGLSSAWLRARDFVQREGLAASLGVIGESLENPSPAYLDVLREIGCDERFELWNHGYLNKFVPNVAAGETLAHVGPSADAQFDAISRTQYLIQARLGVTAQIFGPHASGTDDNTYLALARIPEIKAIWFYAPRRPEATAAAVFKREANLEHPLFVPSLAGLQADLASRPAMAPYLALQGHPDMWGDDRFQAFVEVCRWLAGQGCKFSCAPAYLRASKGRT